MDKKSKIALYIIGGVVLLMMIAEIAKPKAINWRDSYSAADKIPLGCYIMFNELETFSTKPILTSNKTAYEFLGTHMDTLNSSTLVFINNYISPTTEDADAILNFVDKGNSVFISVKSLYGKLRDTLNVAEYSGYDDFFREPSIHSFTSPKLKDKTYTFNDVIENSFITSVDTLNTTIIGQMSYEGDSEKEPNFVKINFGSNNGAFYIHTNPFAFTNYHLLDQKEDYAATILSFLPRQQIIWDNYYKSGRKVISSPLRYVLTSPALKWAFYTSVFALLLFVIFRGKRTQRIIPVVKPLENSTVEFTQTIGELYYQSGDYTNIIAKKINYFLEMIRTTYYLNTDTLNPIFIKKLAGKSSNTYEETVTLIDYIKHLKSKAFHTEKDLIELNKKIEKFINKTK